MTIQDEVLQVYLALFVIYVLLGGLLLLVLKGKDTLFKKLICLPFLPAFLCWGIILACLSFPLFWLYPEKHVHRIDAEGTPEEKLKLQNYRNQQAARGFFRRLAEKAGFVSKPNLPFFE